jgi:hypothetical protein
MADSGRPLSLCECPLPVADSEFLLDKMKTTKSNDEFFGAMKR